MAKNFKPFANVVPVASQGKYRYQVLQHGVAKLDAAFAQQLLSFNLRNRPIRASHVDDMEHLGLSGLLMPSPIVLAFVAASGELLLCDHQHLCTGIASGKTVAIDVLVTVFRVKDLAEYYELFGQFDTCVIRRALPDFTHRAMDHDNLQGVVGHFATIARAIGYHINGASFNDGCSPQKLARLLIEKASLRDKLHDRFYSPDRGAAAGGRARLCKPGIMAAYLYAKKKQPQMTEQFFDELLSGQVSGRTRRKDSPGVSLRNLFMESGAGGGGKVRKNPKYVLNHATYYASTLYMWECHCRREYSRPAMVVAPCEERCDAA